MAKYLSNKTHLSLVNSDNKRVAIVLPKMSINGVQKVHAQLASEFINDDIPVDFVTSDPDGAIVPELPAETRIIFIGQRGKLFFFPELLRYLRHSQPTHVMSAYDDVSVLVLAARLLPSCKYFVLVGLHNSVVEAHRSGSWLRQWKNWLIRKAMRWFYRRADALIAVSNGLAEEASTLMHLPRNTITTIHNPVITNKFQALLAASCPITLPLASDKPVIGFFGRLEPQKNVAMLINAFALVQKAVTCDLLVVGEGSLEVDLRHQCEHLGLTERITFHPFLRNPFPLMQRCDIVVLSSIYEGAPNILIEAMACGTQIVSTNCHYGPSEILQGGTFGQLVPVGDVDALAEALRRTITREFFVSPDLLTQEAMQYTAEASVAAYLKIMGISSTSRKRTE